MYLSKSILPPSATLNLFLRTQSSGPALGALGIQFDRIAVRAVVTIQQFCSHARTLAIEFFAVSLAMMVSQLSLARLPIGRSLRTLHAQTSDQGSMNANPVPATQGMRRGCPRIFSTNPRLR